MPIVSSPASLIKVQFSRLAGLVIWADGKSRPATADEIEQDFGQRALDRVMESSPRWVTISAPRPARRFRVTSVVNHVSIELGELCAAGKREARKAARAAFPGYIVFVVAA